MQTQLLFPVAFILKQTKIFIKKKKKRKKKELGLGKLSLYT